MNELTKLICWRGLPGPVPVAGSNFERKNGSVFVPVPWGSKNVSQLGTGTGNGSAGSCVFLNPRSCVMNWPHCITVCASGRAGRSGKPSWHASRLAARALGSVDAPVGVE
jgi:hypothetical protein